MTSLLLFISSIFAATCELKTVSEATDVKVQYQYIQQAGEVKTLRKSDPVTLTGKVNPRELDIDKLKVSRPAEQTLVGQDVLLRGYDIDPKSLKFEVQEKEGRLVGSPRVEYDPATNVARVTATLKYKEGKFEEQEVHLTGVVVFDSIEEVKEPILLPPQDAYNAVLKLDGPVATIEPIKENANVINDVNSPDRVLIVDSDGCVWYEGSLNTSWLGLELGQGQTYLTSQGKQLKISPSIEENRLHIVVKGS